MSETVSDGEAEHVAETPRLPFPPVVLGIAGCSGSGKTTLAAELAHALGGIHFHLDNYYRDLGHLPYSERIKQNFDDPAMIESPLLAAHVAALARGETIERPLYDFSTHTRVLGRTEQVTAVRSWLWRGCSRSTIRSCCRSTICEFISTRRMSSASSGG